MTYSAIVIKETTTADVPTPDSGKIAFFAESGLIKVKLDDGNVITVGAAVGITAVVAGDGITADEDAGTVTVSANLAAGSNITLTPESGGVLRIDATDTSIGVEAGEGITVIDLSGGVKQIAANLQAGTNISITPVSGGALEISADVPEAGVASLNGETGALTIAAGDNVTVAQQSGGVLQISASGGVPAVEAGDGITVTDLSGGVREVSANLVAGANITITPSGGALEIAATGASAGVDSVNGITGDVTLEAGDNITLTPQSGGVIEIAAAGGGGSAEAVVTQYGSPMYWMVADDLASFLADTNEVFPVWPNRVGAPTPNTYVFQGNSGAGPAYRSNIRNGHGVVRFDGGGATSDTLLMSNSFQGVNLLYARQATIFAVLAPDSATNKWTLLHKGVATGEFNLSVPSTSTLTIKLYNNAGGGAELAALTYGSNPSAATWYVCAWQISLGSPTQFLRAWRNGGAKTETTSFSGTMGVGTDSMIMGRSSLGVSSQFFDGDLAEFLWYPRVMSFTEMDAIMEYLADKYAITVTPVS